MTRFLSKAPALLIGFSGIFSVFFTLLFPPRFFWIAFLCLCLVGGISFLCCKHLRKELALSVGSALIVSVLLISSVGQGLLFCSSLPKDKPLSFFGTAIEETTSPSGAGYLFLVEEIDGTPCPAGTKLFGYTSSPIPLFHHYQGELTLFEQEEPTLSKLQQGYFDSGYLTKTPVSLGEAEGFYLETFSHFLQQKAKALFSLLLPKEEGLFLAVLTGDNSSLTDAQQTSFSRCQVSHLFSVSGLHLSILVAFFLALCSKLELGFLLPRLLALPGVGFLLCLSGFSPSALRAGLMFLASIVAVLLGRKTSPFQLLGISVSLMVFSHPALGVDLGFLLSVFATFGILFGTNLLSKRMNRTLYCFQKKLKTGSKIGRWFSHQRSLWEGLSATGTLFASSLSAMIATTPILLLSFPSYSLAGPFANLIFVPLASPLVGAGVFLLVAFFLGCPLPLLQLVATPFGWLCRLIDLLANFLSHLPIASPISVSFLLIALVLGLVIFFAGVRTLTSPKLLAFFLAFVLLVTVVGPISHYNSQSTPLVIATVDSAGKTALIRTEEFTLLVTQGMTGQTGRNLQALLSSWGRNGVDLLCLASSKAAVRRVLVNTQLLQEETCLFAVAPEEREARWSDSRWEGTGYALSLTRNETSLSLSLQGELSCFISFGTDSSPEIFTFSLASQRSSNERFFWAEESIFFREQTFPAEQLIAFSHKDGYWTGKVFPPVR